MRALIKPFNERDIISYVHASLLALGELLEHSGEFMLARYREAVDTVLQYRESKHLIIKQAVIALLPKMAAFAPEKFALSYLDTCTSHLLRVLSTSQTERGTAFSALGAMAAALAKVKQAGDLVSRLPDIMRETRDAFASKVGQLFGTVIHGLSFSVKSLACRFSGSHDVIVPAKGLPGDQLII